MENVILMVVTATAKTVLVMIIVITSTILMEESGDCLGTVSWNSIFEDFMKKVSMKITNAYKSSIFNKNAV